jgi:hypothetical protein
MEDIAPGQGGCDRAFQPKRRIPATIPVRSGAFKIRFSLVVDE